MTDARRVWTGKRPALLVAAVSCVVGVFFVLPLEWRRARLDRVERALAEAARSGITTAHVRVEVVDILTGRPVPLDEIQWFLGGEQRFAARGFNRVRRDPTTGTIEFEAPVGEIEILPVDGRFSSTPTSLVVLPGENEAVLEVLVFCELVFVFHERGEPIPLPWVLQRWAPEPVGLDGEGRSCGCGSDQHEVRVTVDEPGRYRVEIPEIHGYEPIPVQTVTAVRGERVERVLELVPTN